MDLKGIRVFLDLDGVVSDFSLAMCQTMGLNHLSTTLRDRLENNYMVSNEVCAETFWNKVTSEGTDWWANIPLTPWAHNLYNGLSNVAPVCFLTAPHDNDPLSLAGKAMWIKKHFKTDCFLVGKRKEFCASPKAVLIDDYIRNVQRFVEAGGLAYHWPNPDKLRNEGNWEQEIDKVVGFVKEAVRGNVIHV